MRLNTFGIFLSCIALAELSALAGSVKLHRPPHRSKKWGIGWDLAQFKPKEGCSARMDLLFVIDASGSITPENFKRVCYFVSRFMGALPVSRQNVHTGVIVYSTGVNVEWDFTASISGNQQRARLAAQGLYHFGGTTNTAKALEVANTIFFGENGGARPGVPKVVVLLTDGVSNHPKKTVAAAARLRKQGVVLVVLGVGKGINRDECRSIVGCDNKDCSLFLSSGWENISSSVYPMLEALCNEIPKDAVCGEWSEWSPCSATCGEGVQTSERFEVSPPTTGTPPCPTCPAPVGSSCEAQGGLRRTRSCIEIPCPVDAACGDWTPWSPWSSTCGNATRERHRTPFNNPPPQHGGRRCEELNPPQYFQEHEMADQGPCPEDCVYGPWGPCEHCKNGRGTMMRHMIRTGETSDKCPGAAVSLKVCKCLPGAGGGEADKASGSGLSEGKTDVTHPYLDNNASDGSPELVLPPGENRTADGGPADSPVVDPTERGHEKTSDENQPADVGPAGEHGIYEHPGGEHGEHSDADHTGGGEDTGKHLIVEPPAGGNEESTLPADGTVPKGDSGGSAEHTPSQEGGGASIPYVVPEGNSGGSGDHTFQRDTGGHDSGMGSHENSFENGSQDEHGVPVQGRQHAGEESGNAGRGAHVNESTERGRGGTDSDGGSAPSETSDHSQNHEKDDKSGKGGTAPDGGAVSPGTPDHSQDHEKDKKSEGGGVGAAAIAGGVIGGLILAGAAAGGGYYYFNGGKGGSPGGPSEINYDDSTQGKDVLEEEREAMISVDDESNMWADQ